MLVSQSWGWSPSPWRRRRNGLGVVDNAQDAPRNGFADTKSLFSSRQAQPLRFEPQKRAHSPQVLPDASASRAAGLASA